MEPNQDLSDSSLENPSEPVIESTGPAAKPPKRSRRDRLKGLISHLNIYILGFCLMVIIVIASLVVVYLEAHRSAKPTQPASSLSVNSLNQLAASGVSVGTPQQVLTVESSSIFAGQVLAKNNFQVAGQLTVGGHTSLSSLSVTGSSVLGNLQASSLAISGNSSVSGSLAVQNGLSVIGSGSFSGNLSANQLNASSLNLTGDLTLNRHLDVNGPAPSRVAGSGLGSGGTVSVSGTDTSGSITISTGSSPPAGCLVTVNFVNRFNSTPHVLLTPIGSAAGGLSYYVNRSNASFSVCLDSAAPAASTFGFDYLVVD